MVPWKQTNWKNQQSTRNHTFPLYPSKATVFAKWGQKWTKLPLLVGGRMHLYIDTPYILHQFMGRGIVPTPLHHCVTLQSLDHGELKDFHSMSNCLKSKYYLILWLLARVIFYHSALYSYWMMLGHFNKKHVLVFIIGVIFRNYRLSVWFHWFLVEAFLYN